MATIDINGTSLHYERSGQGPAILFVHGAFGDANVWADQARRFSKRYTCVRYDRRGSSRSARGDTPISKSLHAADAAELIEALELAPCLLVASSLGASIAVEVALDHAHLLRGIVLSEPPLFSLDPDAAREAMALLGPLFEQAATPGGERAAADAFLSLICPGLWSALDETAKDRYRANADIAFTDIRSPGKDVTAADLATITLPALVLGGGASNAFARWISAALATALPDARFVELDGSGHVTYFERPEEFAAAVATFAAEIDRDVRLR
jgi:3-oxoadipate enol-lactonase